MKCIFRNWIFILWG